MNCIEIKNNMYQGLGLIKNDGSQINLGPREYKEDRKIILKEDEVNKEQLRNLANLNIISVKKIKKAR